jgi:hypothetical protein
VTSLRRSPKRVVKFYNGRGTAEPWLKEGRNAIRWTRLSCRRSKDNQTRLQLFALAYNLGNFLRQMALPREVKHGSLTTLGERPIKIGANVVSRSKNLTLGGGAPGVVRGDPGTDRSAAAGPRDGLGVRKGVESRWGGGRDGESPSRKPEPWRREASSAVAARGFRDSGRDSGRNSLEWRYRLDSNASWDHPRRWSMGSDGSHVGNPS